jgi:hypothetical protein
VRTILKAAASTLGLVLAAGGCSHDIPVDDSNSSFCGHMVRFVSASHEDLGTYRAAARALQSIRPPADMPEGARSALRSLTATVISGSSKASLDAELERTAHRRSTIHLKHYFVRLCRAR